MPTPAPTVFPPQTSLSFDFSDWQVSNPGPLPGDQLDAQLVTLKDAHNTLLTFIDPLFNDDGTLANGSVGIGQLAPSAISEVGKPNADAAAASAAAAAASATQANTSKTNAATSATNAASSASAAASSASSAASSATTAGNSATSAANSLTAAITNANNAAASATAANTSKNAAAASATAAATSAQSAATSATNFGAALSDHMVNEFNPHGVTAEQVGKTIAQWNAALLQGRDIATTPPLPSQVLSWDAAALRWTPANLGDLTGGGEGGSNLPIYGIPGEIGYVLTALDPVPDWRPAPPDQIARNLATAAQADIDAHEALTNNPHNVTAAQVGAITQGQADTRYVNIDGDGMIGPLTITGATASDMLRVTQTGAGGVGIRVENTASDTSPTVINGSGIGIGTATPVAGALQIDGAGAMIVLNTASPAQRRIEGKTGNLLRWQIILGNNAAETGADAGSDYWLYRYDDLGTTGALSLHIRRDNGNWGIGAVANTVHRLLVNHPAAEAVVDARSIRALNLNAAADASANIEFATASGALRGAVRGKREAATNHGSLVLSSALAGVQQDVLTLASNKSATFAGAMFLAQDPVTDMEAVTKRFLNSTIAGATGFVHLTGDTMSGPLNLNATSGLTIQGVAATGSGITYSPWLMIKSDWEQSYLQAWHQAGVQAGVYLVVGSTTPRTWNFRQDGILAAPGNVAIPQGARFDLNNGGGCFLSMESSGALVLYRAPGYYMVRGTDGTWSWVENNNTSMYVDGSGNFGARGNISPGGNFALNNDRSIGWSNGFTNIYHASSGAWFFTAGPDWSRFYFDPNDAGWRWQSGTGFGTTDMALIGGSLTIRGAITAGWTVQSNDPGGFYTSNYADGGGYYYANLARARAASEDMYIQAFHQPNTSAQIRFWVLSTLFGMRNDGTAYAPGAWQDGCDERVKTDIQPITDAIQKISQIEGITYLRTDIAPLYSDEALAKHAQNREADPSLPETLTNPPQGRHAGFLAQSVRAVLPEAITVGETPPTCDPDGEGFNYLNSTAVLALTVQALKELVARVETLESAAS